MAYGMGSGEQPFGLPKRKTIFGKTVDPMAYSTPTVGPMQHSPEQRQAQQPMPEPQKPGFFGKGGTGRAIAGTIGDYLMQQQGMDPVYAPTMMMQQQQEAAARQAQLQRAQELADYEYKKGIDQKYAKPDTYRWRSNSGDLMELGPDGQPRVAFNDPTDKIQWVRAENGDGTFTMVPVGANGPVGGGGGPLPEFTEDDWNSAGGGTGNGVGGF